MAGNIKGITIEFAGETTKLDKALKKINNETKSIDKELREVNRALRFNPTSAELMRQKFTLLGQKVDATERQLKQFKAAEAQLKAQGVSRTSTEFMKVRRNIIEAESKLKHFKAEMASVKYANITAMGNSFKTAGANFRTAGMYATIGGGAMVLAGKKLLEANQVQQDAENKLIEIYKTRMGVNKQAAKSTMELASAIQREGVIGDEVTLTGAQQLATFAKYPSTINALLPAMDNLLVQQKGLNATADDAKNIANLMGKAMMGNVGALKRVGISFSDSQAEILKYGTEEEKAAVLAEVITQNVGNMNKVFAETDAGKIQQAKNAMGDLAERLGAVLLPALGQAANWISNSIMPKLEQLVGFIEGHPIIAKIAVAITGLLVVGGPLLIFIGAIISAVGTIMTSIGGLTSALSFLAGPIGIVIAAIAAAVAIGILLYKNWDTIKAKALEIKDSVANAWDALKARVVAIFNGIKSAVSAAWNAIKSATIGRVKGMVASAVAAFLSFKAKVTSTFNTIKNAIINPIRTAVNKIKSIIAKVKGFFPIKAGKLLSGIKLPHFKISGSFSIKKKTVPHLSIDWYKNGGIFDQPTIAGIGEAGPEAVVPLDKFWKKLENLQGGDSYVLNIYANDGMNVDQLVSEIQRRIIETQNRKRVAYGGNR